MSDMVDNMRRWSVKRERTFYLHQRWYPQREQPAQR